MIKTYDYNLDEENLEVFPKEIWSDPYIVFHGTSEYHSENIEQNGLIKGHSPFAIEDGKELVRVLRLPEVVPFDIPSVWDLTTAKTLDSYIAANQQKDFRFSCSYLSYFCVSFAKGKRKGGQTLGNIRDAKEIIRTAITSNANLQDIITEPILRLYKLTEDIENANSVIYAIKLPKELSGITEENGVIYSNVSLPKELIVGKVIIPNDVDENAIDLMVVKEKNKKKLLEAGHLGVILGRRKFYENDD